MTVVVGRRSRVKGIELRCPRRRVAAGGAGGRHASCIVETHALRATGQGGTTRQEFVCVMLPTIVQSTTIPILEQVVNFAQARHAILAGNIANLDTPGYRVRDLSLDTFQERLEEAVKARHERNQPQSPGLLEPPADDKMRRVRDSIKSILYHDDSNVGIEQQTTEMTKNRMMHNMAISIMQSHFRLLQTAVSERV